MHLHRYVMLSLKFDHFFPVCLPMRKMSPSTETGKPWMLVLL